MRYLIQRVKDATNPDDMFHLLLKVAH